MTQQEFENNWEIIKEIQENKSVLDKGIKDDYEMLCSTPIRKHNIEKNQGEDFSIKFTLDNRIGNIATYYARIHNGQPERGVVDFYDKVSFGWGIYPLEYLPKEYSKIVELYAEDIKNLKEKYKTEIDSHTKENEEFISHRRRKR